MAAGWIAEESRVSARGEAHHWSKLTADRVRQIRGSALGCYRLAREHGVTPRAIRLVKRRMTWKHVA